MTDLPSLRYLSGADVLAAMPDLAVDVIAGENWIRRIILRDPGFSHVFVEQPSDFDAALLSSFRGIVLIRIKHAKRYLPT